MPKRQERHAANKTDWGTEPPRSQEVAAAAASDPDPAKRAAARKNTRDWCKGKRGRLHIFQIVYRRNITTAEQVLNACGWTYHYDYREFKMVYRCGHEKRCTVCDKIDYSGDGSRYSDRSIIASKCPRYEALTPAITEALRKRWEAWRDAYLERSKKWLMHRRRKMTTGPTHYRKPSAN